MKQCIAIAVLSCAGLWLEPPSPAAAQNMAPYNPPIYTSPPTSPYLNLGVNANGLSNYQTLVRPMIEEQEMNRRQSAALQQLQRQGGASPHAPEPSEAAGRNGSTRGQSPVRFMHYSHYYPARQ